MDENIKSAIRQTAQTVGWKYIEAIFHDEVVDGKKPTTFNTEGKSNEMIAREVTAREMAAKLVVRALNKIEKIAKEEKVKQVVYK